MNADLKGSGRGRETKGRRVYPGGWVKDDCEIDTAEMCQRSVCGFVNAVYVCEGFCHHCAPQPSA